MSTTRQNSTRPSRRLPRRPTDSSSTPPALPIRAFTLEFLNILADRDEPDTASEADTAGPWHLEPDPKGGWAVLRHGESFKRAPAPFPPPPSSAEKPRSSPPPSSPAPAATCATASPPSRTTAAIPSSRTAASSAFWEDFIAAINVLASLMVSPRDFALLLDAMRGLALEHVDKIAVARLADPES